MIAPQTYSSYPTFGTSATKCQPVQVKYETGYIPGDVLPAEHLNWFLAGATSNITLASAGIVNLQQEMQTILCCAGQAPSSCLTCVDQVYNAMMYQINASAAQRAPTSHASSATTYGVGTADSYGHLKISDTYTEVLSACSGVAASQKALACVYAAAGGKAGVGNTAGCPLGTASAGVATTAARSDHVHSSHVCTTVTIDAPGTGSWDEGLRINRAPSSWALLNIGGLANSINGCNGAFTISCYEPEGTKLFVAWQGSCASSYFEPEGNAGAVRWHGNVCGVASCASSASSAEYAGYATSAGTAGTASTASCLNGFENNNNVPKDANCVTYNAITYYAGNGPTRAQGASVDDGALYSQAWSDVWVGQIAQDYRNGRLFVRGRNNGTWMPWLNIIDSGNIGSQSVACATNASYLTGYCYGKVGEACWSRSECTKQWSVSVDDPYNTLECDVYKAFVCAAGGNLSSIVGGGYASINGIFTRSVESVDKWYEADYLQANSQHITIYNCNREANQAIWGSVTSQYARCFSVGGVFI